MGRTVTQSLEAFSLNTILFCCRSVDGAAVSDLTGVGGQVQFPQLDSPVQPDDGAEGERWQHALLSSGNLLAECCRSSRECDVAR